MEKAQHTPPMTGTRWAVVVGIDIYEQPVKECTAKCDTNNRAIEYDYLQGAVQDAFCVQEYLIKYMGVERPHIRTLVTKPWDYEERDTNDDETNYSIPTYSEIVRALNWVLKMAQRGDLVYFHYSGHGSQATTVFPELKGTMGLDEALVPTDVHNGGGYLRDIELALWLKKMVGKGIITTVVLDSCHSGSATRGSGTVKTRGVNQTYKSKADDEPSAEFIAELAASGIGTGTTDRGNVVKDHWLLEPREYTLLAACLPHEEAREYEDEDDINHGALTYWLLDTLQKNPMAAASTRDLYRRIVGRMRNLHLKQTPVIGGSIDRSFFGINELPADNYISVDRVVMGSLDTSPRTCQVHLGGGLLHGVRQGSEYAIYPPEGNEQVGQVRITSVERRSSIGTIINLQSTNEIEPGYKAILRGVPAEQRYGVRLSSNMDAETINNLRKAWSNAAKIGKIPWMKLLLETDNGQPTFCIDMDNEGNFQIQDGDGAAVPNLEPPLPRLNSSKSRAPMKLIERLRHLTLYQVVRTLENNDQTSTLRNAVVFELMGRSQGCLENTASSDCATVDEDHGIYIVKNNDSLDVRVKNNWHKEIFFTIFDLQPLYSIQQIYPYVNCESLRVGEARIISIKMQIPDRCIGESCHDILKIFAMPEDTSLAVLEIPNLCEVGSARGGYKNLQSVLDNLRSPFRNAMVTNVDDWATADVTIQTMR